MGKYFCLFISISLFPAIESAAQIETKDNFAEQRQIFLKAEGALKRRHITPLPPLSQKDPRLSSSTLFGVPIYTLSLEQNHAMLPIQTL